MTAISDYLSTGFSSMGPTLGTITPQYRVNETPSALQQDTAIASSRALQDYTQRTVPDQMNAAAAQGNFGSSGFGIQVQRGRTDYLRNQNDIGRMYARNMTSIAQQRVLAAFGSVF